MFSLATILGFITGLAGPISSITSKIADLKIAQEQAKTNQERIHVEQEIHEAESRKAVLVAEAGHRIAGTINAAVRVSLTIPVAAFLTKMLLWDKVVGSFYGCANKQIALSSVCTTFRTDPVDQNMWWVIGAVIAFYFAYDMFSKSRRS